MHPTHFRFDMQEGHFPYNSPMGKVMLEGLRRREIPADLADQFSEQQFYEDCMIVQIYDHKSTAPSQSQERVNTGPGKSVPFSIHNYNALLTPSSFVPYEVQNPTPAKPKDTAGDDAKSKSAEQRDKENMPAPILPTVAISKKPKVTTIVLRPTESTKLVDLGLKAAEKIDGRRDSRDGGLLSASVPPTPTIGVPPTPQTSMAPPAKRIKKTAIQLDSGTIYGLQSQIVLATTAPLDLEPVSSATGAAALLESLAHPSHAEKPPAPKTRKRTVAEMAADEALAAEEERYMLTLDERLSSNAMVAQGGANTVGGDVQAGGASFEPRFERFKTIESIKLQAEENKRLEKQKQAENERKNRQDQERNKLEMEAEQRRAHHQLQVAQRQAQQDARQRQMQAEAKAQAQARAQANQGNQNHVPHAHPQSAGMTPNGIPAPPQRFHQQVSQAQASSPIVRNGTPQSNSSPPVNNMGNVPMQQSTSSMGGSPPRPGSVVHQNPPHMGGPTANNMTAQRSQQSHTGTPRMPVATPNNIQSTPVNRQISQTPRMSQNSPLQGQIGHTTQMPMGINGQPVPINAAAAAQYQQQQRMRAMLHQNQIAQAQAGMNGMMPGPQMNPQLMQAQALRMQQQQSSQGMAQVANNYQAQMVAMAQRGGVPQGMNQNFMANQQGINIQSVQQLQNMQQQAQQMQSIRMQAAAQAQNHLPQGMQQSGMNQQNPQAAAQHAMFMQMTASFYNQLRSAYMAQNPGNFSEEIDRQLKQRAQAQAQAQVQAQMNARAQQRRQQMMAAQQNGMQQGGMNMQHQMGM